MGTVTSSVPLMLPPPRTQPVRRSTDWTRRRPVLRQVGQRVYRSTSYSSRADRRPTRVLTIAPAAGHLLPQRLERRAKLRREECRFLPCREVSAAVDLIEVGEAGVGNLDPAARGR